MGSVGSGLNSTAQETIKKLQRNYKESGDKLIEYNKEGWIEMYAFCSVNHMV